MDVQAWLDCSRFASITKETYKRYFDQLRTWTDESLLTLTPSDYCALVEARHWKDATARNCLNAIRSYMHWRGQDAAPIMCIKWRRPAFRPQRALSLEDKARLQLACHKTPAGKQLSIILAVLWTTWMRVSEVVRCELRDLDLEGMKIGVIGKGNRFRKMALTAETAGLLGGWVKYGRSECASPETHTVFVNTRTGKPLTVEGLKANLSHLANDSGIQFSAHDFRRGAATHAVGSGMPTRVAQLQGGWRSLAMLEHYTDTLGLDDVRRFLEAA
ncbi:MAG: tyrosine-type recombinase/integrase [Anaerolineales bacterium]|jgi:site-specific recombinase XerD